MEYRDLTFVTAVLALLRLVRAAAPSLYHSGPHECLNTKPKAGAPAAERKRLSALLEAAPDATIAVDVRDRIVLANPRVESLLGFRPDELVGRSVDQLLPQRYGTAHAGERASFGASPRARPMGRGLDRRPGAKTVASCPSRSACARSSSMGNS